MPKMTLSKQQVAAIALLAQDVPKLEVARRLGISARTIHRWCDIPEFAEQVEKQSDRFEVGKEIIIDETTDKAVDKFGTELEKYLENLFASFEARLSYGMQLWELAAQKIPEVAQGDFSPGDVSRMMATGDAMVKGAMEQWGAALAIQETLKRLNGDS